MHPSLSLVALLAVAAEPQFPKADDLPARPALPDLLVMLDGTKITTKEQWRDRRAPELKALFQHYMYGPMPPAPAKVTAQVRHEDAKAFGGKATLREIEVRFAPDPVPPIYLLLVTPNAAKGKVPAFVGMNFSGNHTLVADPGVRLPTAWLYGHYKGVKDNHATEAGRGTAVDVWALEQSIDRGYAVATFYSGDIDPDQPKERGGARPWLAEHGGADSGSIACWAWGISRAVDYLVTVPALDAQRLAVVGHSRLGKTALLAAAFDDRIALVIPSQAGCGGTAPSRGQVGESVKQLNDRFPHWFNAAFKTFNDRTERLPFDQHALVALLAPRPVLFPNAVQDQWANPDGQFAVLKAAEPVYKLFGVEGVAVETRPEPGKLVASRLGYYYRAGTHSMTADDWQVFRDFADKHLPGK